MLTMTGNLVVITSGPTVSAWRHQLEAQPNAKVFSLDLGTSASVWSSRLRDDNFYTLSVYPLLKEVVRGSQLRFLVPEPDAAGEIVSHPVMFVYPVGLKRAVG